MRALLMLAAHDVNLDRSVGHTRFFLGLGLIDDPLRHENLLDDLPSGRHIVVQQDAGGHAPAHDEHHDGHDDHHHLGALHLSTRLVAGHVHLRDEREHTEQDQGDQIRQRGAEAVVSSSVMSISIIRYLIKSNTA